MLRHAIPSRKSGVEKLHYFPRKYVMSRFQSYTILQRICLTSRKRDVWTIYTLGVNTISKNFPMPSKVSLGIIWARCIGNKLHSSNKEQIRENRHRCECGTPRLYSRGITRKPVDECSFHTGTWSGVGIYFVCIVYDVGIFPQWIFVIYRSESIQ